MDASFAPQYIFLLKSICIMSQIALHDSIFSMFFDRKIKSLAIRKPLPSHQERCLAPRNRYAASLSPETVTILQRVTSSFPSQRASSTIHMTMLLCPVTKQAICGAGAYYQNSYRGITVHRQDKLSIYYLKERIFIPHFTGYVITYPCWD